MAFHRGIRSLIRSQKGMRQLTLTDLQACSDGMGLGAVKQSSDHVLLGDRLRIAMPSREAAETLTRELLAAGADASVGIDSPVA